MFDPDRFLPEREAEMTAGAYIPFGLGPRMCIGRDFAYVEGMTVLSVLLRHVAVSRVPGAIPRPAALVTLRPAAALPLVVSCRGRT